jgi:hypothetical protein
MKAIFLMKVDFQYKWLSNISSFSMQIIFQCKQFFNEFFFQYMQIFNTNIFYLNFFSNASKFSIQASFPSK